MSTKVKPSPYIHTEGMRGYAPPPLPGSVAISNHTTVVLPSHSTAWSWATIAYAVIALLTFFIFVYGMRKSQKREGYDTFIARIVFLLVWLGAGLALVMMASHTKNTIMAWSIVVAALAPALIMAFWVAHAAHTSGSNKDQ